MKRIQRVDLIDGPILPALLSFAFPILLSNIFQQLYNTSDVMIVGRFLGQKSLAAVGATSAIFDLIVGFAVGVGAVKFYDLKTDRRNGYDFDLEAMVSFEGETGPYVQYAYARIQSILRKANFTPSTDATYSLSDPESWEIIKLLQDFSRVVKRAAENYDPSLIAKYAINLAQAFNKYYAHTRILDESPERESRLALSYSTAVVLKEALRLLGVDAPEKM